MAEILVTAAQVRAAAEEIRSLNGQFKSRVSDLENSEVNLSTMWEGEANRAFRQAFAKDKGQMNNFSSLIEQYCVALENIAAQYEKAEQMNTSTGTTRTY